MGRVAPVASERERCWAEEELVVLQRAALQVGVVRVCGEETVTACMFFKLRCAFFDPEVEL